MGKNVGQIWVGLSQRRVPAGVHTSTIHTTITTFTGKQAFEWAHTHKTCLQLHILKDCDTY